MARLAANGSGREEEFVLFPGRCGCLKFSSSVVSLGVDLSGVNGLTGLLPSAGIQLMAGVVMSMVLSATCSPVERLKHLKVIASALTVLASKTLAVLRLSRIVMSFIRAFIK